MCDLEGTRGEGWLGWQDIPSTYCVNPKGDWVDLSHPLHKDMPRVAFFPQPRFERIWSIPEKQINVTEMQMVVHTGTHIDSPRHFFNDGPAFEDVPLDRLAGKGIVWPIEIGPEELIEPVHLEGSATMLEPGGMLVLNTGWHKYSGQKIYDRHPSLSVDAAHWIIEKKIKLVGVDFPTPDLAVPNRDAGFDYPVHRALLSRGILIAEHVTNLDAVSGGKVELICAALAICGGDGAPARIMARPID